MVDNDKTEAFDVFVSYSRRDSDRVREVIDHLRSRDLRIWFDQQVMLPGIRIRDAILAGIRSSNVIIVFISQNSLASRWVLNELDAAMMRELNGSKAIVVPVILGRIEDDAIPGDLQGKNYLDLRHNFQRRWLENRDIFTQNIIALTRGESFGSDAIVLAIGDPVISYLASYKFRHRRQSTKIDDLNMKKIARAFGIALMPMIDGDDTENVNVSDSAEDSDMEQATDEAENQSTFAEKEMQRFLNYPESARRFVQRYGEFSLQQLVLFSVDQMGMDLTGGFSEDEYEELFRRMRIILTAFGLQFAYEEIEVDSSIGTLLRITKDSMAFSSYGDLNIVNVTST